MAVTRSASASILGYIYQFDYSIKCLLNLPNDDDYIEIENIEDIDVHSCTEDSAIQCKYYAGTEYNHSIIAKPIRFMLNHYFEVRKGSKQAINYKLYGYYQSGQEKLSLPVSVDFLKEHFLTYTKDRINHKLHEDLGLSDDELSDFLTFLSIDINAEENSIQFSNIINNIKNAFGCDNFEAEHYYYNNALKVVSHIAKQSNLRQRRISKREFLEQINKKEILFNKWFLQYKGERVYYTTLRKQYFSSINISERFFLIGVGSSFIKAELKELLLTISQKWSKISNREPNPFCPYIYIHNIDEVNLTDLKLELQKDDFEFIDGYPFKGSDFSVKSITQKISNSNKIKLRLIDTVDNLNLVLQSQGRTKEIYQFYINESFWEPENTYTKHIKIQVKEITSIKEII
ncbi:MAG: DUF4297 family anti-phage-associated protein [Petrimonas sp.]|nr:DUF4297 family anti-phage-associated protein [Petrimonas sp.]